MPLVRQIRDARRRCRGDVGEGRGDCMRVRWRERGASPQLRGIQDHAFDMRVNVEGRRTQESD